MADNVDVVGLVKEKKQQIFNDFENLELLDDQLKKIKIDEIYLKTEEVKKFVYQHLPQMIAYEIRVCNDLIKEIDNRISQERDATNSKPFKFSFSLKNDDNKVLKKPIQTTVDVTDNVSTFVDKNVNNLKNLLNDERILNSDETDFKEIILDTLTNCKILIYGAPSSLRLANLQNCKIYTGPFSSSIFIDNCKNCEFKIIGQQFRIHDTTDCDIYQHVTSRSIIENCSNLRFGCYNWNYDKLIDDSKKAGIDLNVNNWKEIDDFDCLTNPSPNWSFISENK